MNRRTLVTFLIGVLLGITLTIVGMAASADAAVRPPTDWYNNHQAWHPPLLVPSEYPPALPLDVLPAQPAVNNTWVYLMLADMGAFVVIVSGLAWFLTFKVKDTKK